MIKFVIIGAFVLCIVVQIYDIRKRKRLEKEKQILEQVLLEEKKQYRDIAQMNQTLRYANHDLQKYMHVLQEMVKEQDADSLSGDDVVAIVLRQKKTEAEKKGIRFDCRRDVAIDWKPDKSELIRLFANLLDNAIEAAEKAETDCRFISVCIEKNSGDGNTRIEIQNSKRPEDTPLEHGMQTTKEDTDNHGYGTGIIREIVQKYGGDFSMGDRGDVFVGIVTMPG